MKKITLLLKIQMLLFGTLLFAQQKHLWQLPDRQPIVKFNQKGQMSVFTYDRLSIYNTESGALEKSYDFLTNRSPYIWPITAAGEHSEDFNFYHFYGQNKDLSGNRGVYVRFDAGNQKWEVATDYPYPAQSYRSMDIQGRELVEYGLKKTVWLYKPNGKKIKQIADAPYVNVIAGGKYGFFTENNQIKKIDFSTDVITDLALKGIVYKSDQYPEWLIIKDGENRTLFNPFTNQKEVKDANDPKKEIPSQYAGCNANFKDAVYFGNYIYTVVPDTDAMLAPDKNGAVPFVVQQFSTADCSLVRTFPISVSESENTDKTESVKFIYDGVRVMDSKYKAESQARADFDAKSDLKFANKKEAAELSKELLINFKDGGDLFAFSLLDMKGRDITHLAYTKKYLSHLKGEITAVVQFTCGTSRILVVSARVDNTVSFKFIRIHHEGVYQFTKDIASVYNQGNLISQNLAIGLTKTGTSVKADVTRIYQATGKKETAVVFATCGGDWK